MLAAILKDKGVIEAVVQETPLCGIDEILVKVFACGICGSDIRIFRYGNSRIKFPAIVGHEISGVILEKGKNVEKFSIGDRIALGADIPCNNCDYCKQGYCNNCDTNLAIGYQYQGGFAEYIKLDRNVWDGGPMHKIPEKVSFEEATIAEPLGCAINGIEILPNRTRDSIAIIGAGVLGCLFTELAPLYGYGKVFLVDVDERKLSMAKELGVIADEYLHPDISIKADAVIVACADIRAQRMALDIVRKRGAVNFFAGLPPNIKESAFSASSANTIHYKEIFLTGSHGSTPEQHKRAVELIVLGKVRVRNLITHIFSLRQIEEAFRVAESPNRLKVVVKP